jgi:hypothetical protein
VLETVSVDVYVPFGTLALTPVNASVYPDAV